MPARTSKMRRLRNRYVADSIERKYMLCENDVDNINDLHKVNERRVRSLKRSYSSIEVER